MSSTGDRDSKMKQIMAFANKVTEIENESFWQFTKQHTLRTSMQIDPETYDIAYEKSVPSEESVKAFLLSFRQFFQDNDRFFVPTIHTILQTLSAIRPNVAVSQPYDLYKRIMAQKYMPSGLPTPKPVPPIDTIKDLIKIFLYGHYAHSDENLAKIYGTLKEDDGGRMESHYFFFIGNILDVFQWVLMPLRDEAQKIIGK